MSSTKTNNSPTAHRIKTSRPMRRGGEGSKPSDTNVDAALIIGLSLALARSHGAGDVPDALRQRLAALAEIGNPAAALVCAWLEAKTATSKAVR
ncbi:hypothetical protein [Pararhizobium sp. O133]|uniref:hypothetical protein n=1 Tax=Pararhizobium sp. O133 TaxID=3449278 RepID=UPI003F686C4D